MNYALQQTIQCTHYCVLCIICIHLVFILLIVEVEKEEEREWFSHLISFLNVHQLWWSYMYMLLLAPLPS